MTVGEKGRGRQQCDSLEAAETHTSPLAVLPDVVALAPDSAGEGAPHVPSLPHTLVTEAEAPAPAAPFAAAATFRPESHDSSALVPGVCTVAL